MKELVGKLTALDPEAGDVLKVVTYFDTLMDGRVSVETLLRGAATLSGVPVGYRSGSTSTSTSIRVLADGRREDGADPASFPSAAAGAGAVVWLERVGAEHANDAMIRERLAMAIAQSAAGRLEQSPERRAVELLLTSPLESSQRLAAEARLQLDPLAPVRAVALPSRAARGGSFPSTILATPWGLVRGGITRADADGLTGRAGIGVAGKVSELAASWRTALVALALSDEANETSHADDLGSLVSLANLINDAAEPPADLTALEKAFAHSWSLAALQALVNGESVRGVAAAAGLHHSSIHAKLPELSRLLGYDPLAPLGRTRLFAALLLRRVAQARFDAF
ncbi:MAG: hypothetical protein JWP75_3051 [Frondihabitans sp.]|nr:hypothetical protein [Frondihabitans sp.]